MKDNPFDPRARQRRFGDPELTRRILDRTSGRACQRAERLLADSWDRKPDETAADLLAGHLTRCPACRRTAEILAMLQPLMPRLAERDPGRAFTEAVLRVTGGRTADAVGRRASVFGPLVDFVHLARGLSGNLRRIWQRPRFALEAAWVSAVLTSLLLYSPLLPQEVPSRFGKAVQAGTGLVPEVIDEAGRLAGTAVSAGGELVDPAVVWIRTRWLEAGQHFETLTSRWKQRSG
jgi:hypothetical protein